MKKHFLTFILGCLPLLLWAKPVYLDELDVKYFLQDWGGTQVNQSVLYTPLQVAGVRYERGIGTHSVSRFLMNLDGKAKSFSGLVGADDKNDFSGKMEFQIITDGKVIWSSGIVEKGMSAIPFKVNLKNVKKLALLVKEGGDGIMYDHADWLNAKIETSGSVVPEPVMPESRMTEKYILTPKPKAEPRINSAKVFGLRKGSPMLYTVAATGDRPMRFSAVNLPDGLVLDAETGFIRGSVSKEGTYNIILQATNDKGRDVRVLRLEVGDRICLTPPMGWNSWNCWGLGVNDQKVKDAADFMARNLINHGWSYVNIDDGWEAPERTGEGVLMGNEKFPDFKGLSDYVHSRGLKFGIYSSPGPTTCGNYLGSYKHDDIDAQTWADWGIDYLKYDYCGYNDVEKNPTEENIKAPYVWMKNALDKVDRDIVYCVGFGAPNVWNWASDAGGHLWRTTRDITDEWNVVRSIGFFQDVCAEATRPGKYNDPDMLVVGRLGHGWGAKAHDTYLTPDEQYSHISLWCILSAPLLIGCDMDNMDEFTTSLLTNDEVIEVNQDPLVMPAVKVLTENGQIWYKYLEDGAVAVGFFHVDPYAIYWDKTDDIQSRKYPFMLDFKTIGLNEKYTVRDLWRQQDLQTSADSFRTEVPYHGVTFIKLIPEK